MVASLSPTVPRRYKKTLGSRHRESLAVYPSRGATDVNTRSLNPGALHDAIDRQECMPSLDSACIRRAANPPYFMLGVRQSSNYIGSQSAYMCLVRLLRKSNTCCVRF
jgi:hypothetical protein